MILLTPEMTPFQVVLIFFYIFVIINLMFQYNNLDINIFLGKVYGKGTYVKG